MQPDYVSSATTIKFVSKKTIIKSLYFLFYRLNSRETSKTGQTIRMLYLKILITLALHCINLTS